MTEDEMIVGARVRVVDEIDLHPTVLVTVGATGVIDAIDGGSESWLCTVKLDAHFIELDEWDNRLQVFDAEDNGDCTLAHFEVVRGFA
jgi:hypothetical protein